jgi:hypothetical protein
VWPSPVIAINLMAALLREQYNAQYATGSRAFTETLRAVVGSRGVPQFSVSGAAHAGVEGVLRVLRGPGHGAVREEPGGELRG